MEDNRIVELYWERKEEAIRETALKYGRLCAYIAGNILSSHEDCEECVNDTYLALWNAIPSQRPSRFPAFVGRIARNLALKRYEYLSAAKRNPAAVTSLEELGTADLPRQLGRAVRGGEKRAELCGLQPQNSGSRRRGNLSAGRRRPVHHRLLRGSHDGGAVYRKRSGFHRLSVSSGHK